MPNPKECTYYLHVSDRKHMRWYRNRIFHPIPDRGTNEISTTIPFIDAKNLTPHMTSIIAPNVATLLPAPYTLSFFITSHSYPSKHKILHQTPHTHCLIHKLHLLTPSKSSKSDISVILTHQITRHAILPFRGLTPANVIEILLQHYWIGLIFISVST